MNQHDTQNFKQLKKCQDGIKHCKGQLILFLIITVILLTLYILDINDKNGESPLGFLGLSVFVALYKMFFIHKYRTQMKQLMSEEITAVANNAKFPYADVFKKALDGDLVEVQRLFEFWSKTDTSSAFSHSHYLHEVLVAIGDKKFYSALKAQETEIIKRTLNWLQDRDRKLFKHYPELRKLQ